MFVCRRIGSRARRLPGTERVTLFRATGIGPCAALSSVLFLALILPCAWAHSEINAQSQDQAEVAPEAAGRVSRLREERLLRSCAVICLPGKRLQGFREGKYSIYLIRDACVP